MAYFKTSQGMIPVSLLHTANSISPFCILYYEYEPVQTSEVGERVVTAKCKALLKFEAWAYIRNLYVQYLLTENSCFFITKTNRLMVFKKEVVVYSGLSH